MFGVDTTELFLIAVIALVFIGPKDLPRIMRTFGQWIGKVRGMARHFTSGVETMMREAELEEMEKQWRAENERIMREFPDDPSQAMMPLNPPVPSGVEGPDIDDRPPAERPLP